MPGWRPWTAWERERCRRCCWSNAELQQLASLYSVGQELWRVPVTHFTPWDYNWPFGPPADAISPRVTPRAAATTRSTTRRAAQAASSNARTRRSAKRCGVVGTPYTLNYRSSRVPGRTPRARCASLSGATVPASLKRIELDVQVAGRSSSRRSRPHRISRRRSPGTASMPTAGRCKARRTPR